MSKTKFKDPEDMTYGQRIELGKLVESQPAGLIDESRRFKEAIRIMDPQYVVKFTIEEVEYVERVFERLKYWVVAEKKMLHRDPSSKEKRAGIQRFHDRVKELGTLHAICSEFKKTPDQVLLWNYADVFGMLYVDKERAEYRERYSRIESMEAKKKRQ